LLSDDSSGHRVSVCSTFLSMDYFASIFLNLSLNKMSISAPGNVFGNHIVMCKSIFIK
jgi:hypothetical protein